MPAGESSARGDSRSLFRTLSTLLCEAYVGLQDWEGLQLWLQEMQVRPSQTKHDLKLLHSKARLPGLHEHWLLAVGLCMFSSSAIQGFCLQFVSKFPA